MQLRAVYWGLFLSLLYIRVAAQTVQISSTTNVDVDKHSATSDGSIAASTTLSDLGAHASKPGAEQDTSTTTQEATHLPKQSLSTTHTHHLTDASAVTPAPQVISTFITHPYPPHPPYNPPPPPSSNTPTPQRTHGSTQSTAAILFEAIGGLLGFLLIIGFGRCAYKYHRAPQRDRIAALLDRHRLERELAELEEAEAIPERRSSLVVPPPPPYECAPAYDQPAPQSVCEMRQVR